MKTNKLTVTIDPLSQTTREKLNEYSTSYYECDLLSDLIFIHTSKSIEDIAAIDGVTNVREQLVYNLI
jgi:hypothetical protein